MSDEQQIVKRRWLSTGRLSLLAVLVVVVLAALVYLASIYREREAIMAYRDLGGKVDAETRWPVSLWERAGPEWRTATVLRLSTPSLDDAILAKLGRMPNLNRIILGDAKFGPAGLSSIEGLKQVRELALINTSVRDEDFESIGCLTRLEILDVSVCSVGDAGMSHLQSLRNLKTVAFIETNEGDAGLKHIGRLMSVEILYLNKTSVTDAGLNHLYHMSNLNYLNLTDTQVTAEGVAALQKKLPGCVIEW